MTIGQRIRSKREEKNLGLTELASKVHISKQSLYKYENDIITNIPSNKIEEIADVLETTPAYLMGWEEQDGLITVDLNDAPVPTQEEIYKAMNLYKKMKSLPPEKQAALLTLLEVPQNDV